MAKTKKEKILKSIEKFGKSPFLEMPWEEFMAKLPRNRRRALLAMHARLKAMGLGDPTRGTGEARIVQQALSSEEKGSLRYDVSSLVNDFVAQLPNPDLTQK